jgi:hypothetical protein
MVYVVCQVGVEVAERVVRQGSQMYRSVDALEISAM